MTGVNIHAITEVPICEHSLGVLFPVGLIIVFIGLMSLPLGYYKISLCVAVCGFVLGLLGIYFCSTPTGYYNTYKVTIEENVSLVEFNEKYEILDQEGDIYTIKEREVE